MRQRFAWPVTILISLSILCAGCSSVLPHHAEAVLEKGDDYHLMLLHPARFDPAHRPETFHDCVVDKSIAVSDPASRQKLIDALRSDLMNDDIATHCLFMPHYGLHVTRGSRTLDMLICFHCGQCLVIDDAGNSRMYSIKASGKGVFASLIPD